jgi:hypothetical protein
MFRPKLSHIQGYKQFKKTTEVKYKLSGIMCQLVTVLMLLGVMRIRELHGNFGYWVTE